MKRAIPLLAAAFAVAAHCLIWPSPSHAAPQKRAEITIAGFTDTGSLANFPVLVRLSPTRVPGFSYADCAPGGADIAFEDANGAPLDREIDTWDPAGESLVWVRIPSFASNGVFRLTYKDPSVTVQPPCQTNGAVWQASTYVGVWHFGEKCGTAADSTTNALHGAVNAAHDETCVAADAMAGKGRYFPAAATVDLPNFSHLNIGNTLSFSGWFKYDPSVAIASSTSPMLFYGKTVWNSTADGWYVALQWSSNSDTTKKTIGVNGAGTSVKNTTIDSIKSAWVHVAVVFSNTKAYVYSNGILKGTPSITAAKNLAASVTPRFFQSNYTGFADEVRICDAANSAAWIKAEYQTVADKAFLGYGAVETIAPEGGYISVTGDPASYRENNLPDYAFLGNPATGTYAYQAPACVYLDAARTRRAVCTGWKLLDDADATLRSSADSGESPLSCTIDFTAGDRRRLVWLWREELHVAVTADAGLTVSATPEWVAAGGTTTLSVTDDGASFTHWSGSVDARDARSPSYTVTVNVPKTIHANAATTIRYVAPGGTGDGTSWGSAYGDVRTALLAVSNLTSGASLICVKEGFYNVTNAAAIKMLSPVTVRGGYAGDGFARGGETVLARTNGAPQMAILSFTASNLALESLTISNGWSQASYWGQGVALENGCTATIRDCRFDRNGTSGKLTDKEFIGGALGAQNGTLSIDGCAFVCNHLSDNGGGNVKPLGGAVGTSGARVRISNSTFDRNYVQMVHARNYGGGAIGILNGPGSEIDHCTFTTNYARTGSGSGAYSPSTQTSYGPYGGTILARCTTGTGLPVAIHDCEIIGGWNNAYSSAAHNWVWGGTIFLYYTSATIERTVVAGAGYCGYTSGNCYTYSNGSVDAYGGTLALRNVLIGNSYAGWALGNQGSAITAENCTIAGTQKHGLSARCAAAYFQVSGSASFRNCIFRNNAEGDLLVVAGNDPAFEYCYTDTFKEGFGNHVGDPFFGDAVHYHPASRAGRYAGGYLTGGTWAIDEETSPTVDAGDPAIDWRDEPQPNLRRINIGYDGGTAAASKSDCTENPVVDETALQIFAYAAEVTPEAAVLSADIASLGGGTNAVVTLVWGDEDHGTDLAAWGQNTYAFTGSHGEWQLLSYTLANPPRGTTYYRFRAENDQGVAWSAPARTFILSSPPALAYDTPDNPVAFLRHTRARLNATLVDDCGMDTTAYALYWPVGDDASAVRVDLNFGDPVPEGPLSFDLSGLVPGATYSYVVAAVNGMGETRLATNAFTTVAASTPVFRYVGAEPSGSGDGSSYDNATDDFQWAIDYTELAGDEIRLVAGTNTLDDTLNVANHPGLVIRGGYTADDVRGGWSCLRRDSSQSRRYRILAASASTLLIDSVGFADGAYETSLTYYGQAVSLINACTATFTNCLFRDNGVLALSAHSGNDGLTSQYGGALGASGGTLTIVDCTFRNNRIWGGNYNTQGFGGAIGVNGTVLTVLRSSFDANCTQVTHSRYGGGGALAVFGGSATISECHFTTNYSRTSTGTGAHASTQTGPWGGTMHLSGTAATVTDCDITGGWISNGTQGGIYYGVGGLVYVAGASADVTFERVRVDDCGFTGLGNSSSDLNKRTQNDFCTAGGKLTVRNSLFTRAYGSTQFCNRGGVLNVVNCTVTGGRGLATSRSQQTFVHTAGTTTNRNTIVWGNTGDALYVEAGATEPAVICCDMEEADPLFKDATAGDYHLKPASPVRDKGDKTGFTRADVDLDHDRRIRGGRPDLGCFEGSLAGLFIIMR
ncbi:MAG: hypothetical protein IJQ73_01060 [Kiritimatiellae bacterium]|nr:hypothetical protein [Kiritimatiellia bacterium]